MKAEMVCGQLELCQLAPGRRSVGVTRRRRLAQPDTEPVSSPEHEAPWRTGATGDGAAIWQSARPRRPRKSVGPAPVELEQRSSVNSNAGGTRITCHDPDAQASALFLRDRRRHHARRHGTPLFLNRRRRCPLPQALLPNPADRQALGLRPVPRRGTTTPLNPGTWSPTKRSSAQTAPRWVRSEEGGDRLHSDDFRRASFDSGGGDCMQRQSLTTAHTYVGSAQLPASSNFCIWSHLVLTFQTRRSSTQGRRLDIHRNGAPSGVPIRCQVSTAPLVRRLALTDLPADTAIDWMAPTSNGTFRPRHPTILR